MTIRSLSSFEFSISRSSRLQTFFKTGVLKNFAKFTGKHLCQNQPATLLKNRLWHSCFPVNFAKFLRTPFFTEQLRWLLLNHRIQHHGHFVYLLERNDCSLKFKHSILLLCFFLFYSFIYSFFHVSCY